MSIRPIYLYGSAVLKEEARSVTKLNDEVVELAVDMFETMYAANGVGLAATQVGDRHRVIVVDVSGMDDSDEEDADAAPPERKTSPGLPTKLALINPVIVAGEGEWKMEEGCLSIPDVRANVQRPQIVTVRYRDIEFREQQLVADGMLARVIQHEVDHLDGVLFIDRIGKTQRSLLSRELRKIRKGEVETRYPVISDVVE